MSVIDGRYSQGNYLENNPRWHDEDAEWKAAQVAAMIDAHRLRPRSICDVGCGTAGVLYHLRALDGRPTLVGYEPAAQAIRLIPESRRATVEVVKGRPQDDARTFDLLLCLDVFEHVEDYYGFLRSIGDKAERFIFHIPIDTTITTVLRPGPVLAAADQVGDIQHFTPALALRALRHAGYQVEDSWHTAPTLQRRPRTKRERAGNIARRVAVKINPDLAARCMTGFPLLVLAHR